MGAENGTGNLHTASRPLISLHRLTKAYREAGGERVVLQDVTMDILEGEFVALLGKSGSGKSTLLNLISGIDTPTGGEVIVDGVSLTRLAEEKRTLFRRQHVGFVFQFFNLIPTLTVVENVTLPLELGGARAADVRQGALAALERVGLAERERSFPDRLSGGEQQRVAIARAVVANPRIILADEPTGNLDDETGRKVLALLLELTRDAGKTLLMATHSREVAQYADKIYRVQDGSLVEETMPKPEIAA